MSNNSSGQNSKKIIAISGATGYLGSAIAKKLSAEGFKIAALYNNATESEVGKLIKGLTGTGHKAYRCDLNNKDRLLEILDELTSKQAKGAVIYGAVHCAWTKPLRKQLNKWTEEDILKQFKENIPASLNLLSVFSAALKNRGEGVIVGITTAAVINHQPDVNLAGYVPAKCALQGLLSSYRTELLPFEVGVYSVAPDFMAGGMNQDIPRAFVEIIKQKNPSKTLVTPQDVAEVVFKLCIGKEPSAKQFTHLVSPHAV